jgi:hypothetical protein
MKRTESHLNIEEFHKRKGGKEDRDGEGPYKKNLLYCKSIDYNIVGDEIY